MDNWAAFVTARAACTASQASQPVVDYIIYTYTITDHFQLLRPIWMLQQCPLPSQYNRCWHRKFNLDILVMMKVVVIGLNWAWQECDIATTGLCSMSATLNYTGDGTQPAAYLPWWKNVFVWVKNNQKWHIYYFKLNIKNSYKINISVFATTNLFIWLFLNTGCKVLTASVFPSAITRLICLYWFILN